MKQFLIFTGERRELLVEDGDVTELVPDGNDWLGLYPDAAAVIAAAETIGDRDATNASRVLRDHQQGYSEVSTPGGPQQIRRPLRLADLSVVSGDAS